jgi:probable F420-dependent oxidoreductase
MGVCWLPEAGRTVSDLVKFGVGVPTATEGLMYPVPYASIGQAVELAIMTEELGFDSVWGNDHIASQRYVQAQFDDPPRYYDPLEFLAFVAAKTSRVRLATCVIVLPFRHPVVAAKQLATLDQLSGGRLVAGVGIGAYREEFEALHPGVALHRGRYAEEAIRSLRLLFTERRASFDGEYVRFTDVESYPKPWQTPLPILSGGNSPGSKDRAARLGDGWLPACLTPDEVAGGISEIRKKAAGTGRELPAGFEVALQVGVAVGATAEAARAQFESSHIYTHMRSLSKSTLKDQQIGDFAVRNLIGTPDQIADQVRRYEAAGVGCLAGLLFAANTMADTVEQIRLFRDEVMTRF